MTVLLGPARPDADEILAKGTRLVARDASFAEVVSGLVAVKRVNAYGEAAAVELLGPGSTLPARSQLDLDEAPSTRLEALLRSHLRWRPAPDLDERGHADVAAAVLAVLAGRARRQQTLALRRRRQTVAQRLADLILELWSMRGPACDPFGQAGLTRRDLGDLLGVDRSAVSHLWARFERRGWLCAVDGELVDVDEAALSGFADRHVPSRARDAGERLLTHERRLCGLVAPAAVGGEE